MTRFAVALLALATTAGAAHAGVEIGGTAGVHIFSDKSALGFVPGPMQTTEGNSSLFAIRLSVFVTPEIGIEAEAGAIPAEPRMTVFDIWDLAVRGGVIYQFRTKGEHSLIPFITAGAGVLSVVYSNNTDIIKKNSEPFGSIGAGAKYKTSGGWGVRFDARLNFTKVNSASSGLGLDIEMLASLFREFGGPVKKEPVEEPKPRKEDDPDHDGIIGAKDKCPTEAEDKDGFQDEDGCPDPDNDGDGIPDEKDKCPNQAEDKDGFQDEDGCPDPDNDGDGIPDAADKCPDQPETKNGFEDEDGCPDEIPAKLAQFTGAIQGINFKTSAADLAGGTGVLDKAVAVLVEFKDIKLEIQGHTDDVPVKSKTFADNQALSQARADTVKAYFVKKGIDEGRLTAKGYGDTVPVTDPKGLTGAALNNARTKNRRVEFKLVPAGGDAGATAPTPPPAPDKPADKPPMKTPAPAPENK